MANKIDLNGKTAVVTGGAQGIGPNLRAAARSSPSPSM
jgi:NAD(P)-dependent dehydrogenase (short-subunit alcohol dehydrogenase family)